MTVRCVVLKNHKNRSFQNNDYSKGVTFIRLRATTMQVYAGEHHLRAIEEVKKIMAGNNLDPADFDFLSFDWLNGPFLNRFFNAPKFLELWLDTMVVDIRHLGISHNGENTTYADCDEEFLMDDDLEKYKKKLDNDYQRDFEIYMELSELKKTNELGTTDALLIEKIKEDLITKFEDKLNASESENSGKTI